MKAGKSQDLPSSSCLPRKASAVIQSESKGLRIREAYDVNPSLRSGEEEMKCLTPTSQEGKMGQILLSLSFVLFRPLMDWTMLSHIGEGDLPHHVHKSK